MPEAGTRSQGRVKAGKVTLALLIGWAVLLIASWTFILQKLIEGGWFYGAP